MLDDRELLPSVHTWTLCGWRTWRWFSLYEPGVSASGWQGNTYPYKYLDSLLMEKMEMVLSGRTWTHCWWSIWREFSLYKPGLSAGRGEGIGSFCTTWTSLRRTGKCFKICTYLDSLLLSGCTWTHCWWRIWREFPLYNLECLLWRTGKCFKIGTYLDSLFLYVRSWTLCWWRTGKCFSLYLPGHSAGGGYGDVSLCTNLDSLLVEDSELLLSVQTWTHCYGGQGNASRSVRILTLCSWRMGKCFSLYVPGLSASGGQENASFSTYLGSLLWRTWRYFLSLHTWTLREKHFPALQYSFIYS